MSVEAVAVKCAALNLNKGSAEFRRAPALRAVVVAEHHLHRDLELAPPRPAVHSPFPARGHELLAHDRQILARGREVLARGRQILARDHHYGIAFFSQVP